jgi:hypothetical protein
MANPTVPFSWQMPEPTDLVTNLPADFEVFGQAVATDLQYLLGGTTGQVLAKASGTDLDFDWVTDATGMTNPMTTTADVIYSSSGSTPARLGIGTANQVLAVNSGATAPEWQTISSGGMTLLSTTTLSGATTTISGISGSYNDLYAVIYGVTNADFNDLISCRPNGSTSISTNVYVTGTSATISRAANDYIRLASNSPAPLRTSANNVYTLTIKNYASTATYKPFENYGVYFDSGSVNRGYFNFGGVTSTSAITSLVFAVPGTTMDTGTVLLYGVK